jgi:hypothetical protein
MTPAAQLTCVLKWIYAQLPDTAPSADAVERLIERASPASRAGRRALAMGC